MVQSNPTYLLSSQSGRYVLRRAPSGPLLSPTAHRIDREYLILAHLNAYNEGLGVDISHRRIPVPRVFCLCEDISVVGAAFYVMEFLEGRVFSDVLMPSLTREERRQW